MFSWFYSLVSFSIIGSSSLDDNGSFVHPYLACSKLAIRIFKLCLLKDTFFSPRWAFFREAIITGFLSPILLRKLIKVLRAGGFVPEREGSSETRDVGMVCP